jgi:serine/threonine protein kinase
MHRLQDGLALQVVLDIAVQVAAGLMHLHSMGIIHRDGRSVNVLLASLDPVQALLGDLGVSHRLSAFAAGIAPADAASKLASKLVGDDVDGPYLWGAPEVIAGTRDNTTVTFASDVYIFGGLLFEMLTGGATPFHWQASRVMFTLLRQRRQSSIPIEVPTPDGRVSSWPGLLNKSTLEAAAIDNVPIPWCVNTSACPGSPGRLEAVKDLMAQCLLADPTLRIRLPTLAKQLEDLLVAEAAEVEMSRLAEDSAGEVGKAKFGALAGRRWLCGACTVR